MRLAWAYTRAQTVELLRYPSFSVPTMIMPAVVFAVIGARRLHAPANLVLVSYVAFAILGVAFFQFGVGVAAERVSPWHSYLRTLPAPTLTRFSGRIFSALFFGLGSGAVVAVLALVTTDVHLSARHWGEIAGVLVLGAVPFALLGIAIGYWMTPKGALPAANLLYFAFAYLGGLLGASVDGRGITGTIQRYVPTHAWLSLLAAAAGEHRFAVSDLATLATFAVGCGLLAGVGYRRDEGQRFR
jgi:ABC-2 type transport system permease protein